MRKINDFSDALNILGAHAGFFFSIANIAAAGGSGLGLSGSDVDKAFWNYFSYIVAAAAALSTITIGAMKLKKACSPVQPELSLLINDETEFDEPQSSITTYEKILYTVASPGAFVGAFNVARFNPDFLSYVYKNPTTQGIFIATAVTMSLFTMLIQSFQQKISNQSALVPAFIETCGKAGAWIGSIFAVFLAQFVIFEKNKINPTEVHVLTGAMAGLFLSDLLLLYAVIKQKGDLKAGNTFIQSPLASDATLSEKAVWWPSFILDVMRALIAVLGNVFAVPNIISLSSSFNNATDGEAKRYTYAALGILSVAAGVNNAARVAYRLLPCALAYPLVV